MVSINLNLVSAFMARCFYVYRAAMCVLGEERKRRFRRLASAVVVLLFLKSISLVNVLGRCNGGMIVFPTELLVYISVEDCVFDCVVVAFTAHTLCKNIRLTLAARHVIASICFANVMVLSSFALILAAAFTFAVEAQAQLLFVLFNLAYVTSIWQPDLTVFCSRRLSRDKIDTPSESSLPYVGTAAANAVVRIGRPFGLITSPVAHVSSAASSLASPAQSVGAGRSPRPWTAVKSTGRPPMPIFSFRSPTHNTHF